MQVTQQIKDREIIISRLINAPRERVFKAWIDPEQVIQWWGPDGFSTTTHEMEVKPGGVWRFIMHGPDGRDFPNRIEFVDIKSPELLVYDHSGEGQLDDVKFRATVTFEDQNGKTNVTMRSVFVTVESRNKVVKEFGAIEGGVQHLGRLEEFLTKVAV